MRRQPRLDTPGSLHHVRGRGINGLEIFGSKKDCENFLGRLKDLRMKEALSIYARILMDTHFHLLAGTGDISLSISMRKLSESFKGRYSERYEWVKDI
ncbi:MAG: transposase [Thermodesulfobacteriota bacterium]|nr:transposase [Thermodesulfobacteriota bacterium]